MTTKAAELERAVQAAFNEFLQENHGHAPRMVEMNPTDWAALRDHIKIVREAEGFEVNTVDIAKTDGRENFRLFGLPVVAGGEDLASPKAVGPVAP